jgi:5-methyltetrahydropteroyltriglutamate--homocysteine methyltransferase
VAFQESIGLPTITDGEFRRRSWSAGFIDAVEGLRLRDGARSRSETRRASSASPRSPYAKARLRRSRRIVADDYRFLKSVVEEGDAEGDDRGARRDALLPWAEVVRALNIRDREAYFSDLVKIYREEIAELAAAGCGYLQLDDTALPCNCDPRARAEVAARGEDADELTERYARLINERSRASRPA